MPRAAGRILHHAVSKTGVIYVVQERDTRTLYFGQGPLQSRISIATPHQPVLGYVQAMTAFLLFRTRCPTVLQLGLGAGSLTHFLWHHFPAVRIEVVEHDPLVAELAHQFFFLPRDGRLHIHINDATVFVTDPTAGPEHYDLLTVDAFDATGLARGMDALVFFDACRTRLLHDGILVINLWRDTTGDFARIAQHIDTVFDQQTLHLPVEGKGNVIIIAFNSPQRLPALAPLRVRAHALQTRYTLPFPRLLQQLYKHNRDTHKPLVLHR